MVDTSSRFTKRVILVVACGGSQEEELPEMLRGAGYQVAVTSEAQCGLNFELADMKLAILFSPRAHWRMTYVSEVCNALRRAAPRLPLMVVGPNDIEAKVRLFELGADDYVVEAFDQAEFLARIKSLAHRN
jgi:DNA-binding response OmpR family regulator